MARFIGLASDVTAGGTTVETFASFSTPTEWVPVTTAQVDRNLNVLDRNDEVRGVRGNAPVRSFASDPRLTFSARAYPGHVKLMLRAALSGTVTGTGTSPASITSKWAAKQTDPLQALQAVVVREGQRDQLCGLWISEVTFNFAVDAEGTMDVTLFGLYHVIDATPGSPGTPTYVTDVDTFKLRDIKVYAPDGVTQLTDVAGVSLTINNGLIDDFASRYSAGVGVKTITIGSTDYRLWFPTRNKIGPQAVTGSFDFGSVNVTREQRAQVLAAEKVVIEGTAGPLTTTPPAKETIRFTLWNVQWTGGDGAGPLVREGDIRSSLDFSALLDPATGKDLEVEYVGNPPVLP